MLMGNAQVASRGNAAPLPINRLVGADELLRELWPDERSRPSLRWLRKQKQRRRLPFVVLGGRVKFCPEMVLAVVGQKFTVRPPHLVHHPALKGSLPAPKELIGAKGLLETLASRLGVQRSLRWLRERQRERALPFIKWDGLVFFCPGQVIAWLELAHEAGLMRSTRRNRGSHRSADGIVSTVSTKAHARHRLKPRWSPRKPRIGVFPPSSGITVNIVDGRLGREAEPPIITSPPRLAVSVDPSPKWSSLNRAFTPRRGRSCSSRRFRRSYRTWCATSSTW